MKLTPREQDRLTIFTMAELARKRRARGIKLNHPEAVALICDEMLEEAGAGRAYAEVVALGGQVLARATSWTVCRRCFRCSRSRRSFQMAQNC